MNDPGTHRPASGIRLARPLLLMALAIPTPAQADGWTPRAPESVEPLAPSASLATIRLPAGYFLELVASEPMIEEPVMCVWDGNSRMYVAEMRTYVQDADGTGTDEPRSRIVRLEDRDGDGRMDHSTVFLDGLVLPRMVLPLDDRVLVQETYDGILWSCRDRDGDGICDERVELFRYGRSGANLEHQDSALTWGIDNWLYTAMGGKRHRFTENGPLITESVPGEFAQWGMATDDVGRQFFSSAGGERPAYGFQQHPVYGKLSLEGGLTEGFSAVWPLLAMPDVQGGPGRLRPDGTLNHFTGCCGQSIYRGDRLPEDLRGDYILCEPVGRLVRRAEVEVVDGMRVLRNAYDHREFLASTDPNFRPIWSATGPDGCLYFVDMYRGIIQESNWVRKGSYLRPVVEEYGLDENIGRGRIWRLRHEDFEPSETPRMLDASSAELVGWLSHPNGWWRDTAQRLLVLRRDRRVVPRLREMSRTGAEPLGRVHALWTLAGMDLYFRGDVIAAFADPDPRVRQTAVRVAEAFLRHGDDELLPSLRALAEDPDIDVRIQVLQSLRYLPGPGARELAIDIVLAHPGNELVAAVGNTTLNHGSPEAERAAAQLAAEDLRRWRAGKEHYRQLCITCHGEDGRGAVVDGLLKAPSLVGSKRLLASDDVAIRILLHGMSGPLDGVEYPGNLMAPAETGENDYIAEVLTYARNDFGNSGRPVKPEDVAAVRAVTAGRSEPWTPAELQAFLPVAGETMADWILTASHGNDQCGHAVDGAPGTRFTTGTPMRPGMWFSIDFGTPLSVRAIELDSAGSPGDYPRGYEVVLSDDGTAWSDPVAAGEGHDPVVRITIPKPRAARHLRIRQTGSHDGLWWSIHELRVFAAGRGR